MLTPRRFWAVHKGVYWWISTSADTQSWQGGWVGGLRYAAVAAATQLQGAQSKQPLMIAFTVAGGAPSI